MKTKIKFTSRLNSHETTMAKLKALRANPDLLVIYSQDAGTIDAWVKSNTSIDVFHAIQKDNSINWIVREAQGLLSLA